MIIRSDPDTWVDRMKRLDGLRDLVVKHIDKARAVQTRHYNRGKKDVRFQLGDLVLRKSHVLSNAAQRLSAKLAPRCEGPYEVIRILSPTVYELRMGASRRCKVHVSELKKFIPPRNAPSNTPEATMT